MGACSSCMFNVGYTLYAETCIGRCIHNNFLHRYKKNFGPDAKHSRLTSFVFGALLIQPIPVLYNNYTYLVADLDTMDYVFIDVGDPLALKLLENSPSAILTTHKHWDHSHGNRFIRTEYPDVPIYGGAKENVPNCTHKVKDGDKLRFGRLSFTVVSTPGHTRDHVCYLLDGAELGGPLSIFTGDHLMLAGCGANFERSLFTMIESLERLKKYPDTTLVWPGHEVSVDNLYNAVFLEPNNEFAWAKLLWAITRRTKCLGTVPSTIGEEKRYNPYLRTRDPEFLQSLGVDKEVATWRQPVSNSKLSQFCYKAIVARLTDNKKDTIEERRQLLRLALDFYEPEVVTTELMAREPADHTDDGQMKTNMTNTNMTSKATLVAITTATTRRGIMSGRGIDGLTSSTTNQTIKTTLV